MFLLQFRKVHKILNSTTFKISEKKSDGGECAIAVKSQTNLIWMRKWMRSGPTLT
jgi:hypothetical protein